MTATLTRSDTITELGDLLDHLDLLDHDGPWLAVRERVSLLRDHLTLDATIKAVSA